MTDIKEKVSKQMDAGFNLSEIRANLIAEGYTREEIQDSLAHIPQEEFAARQESGIPWKTILSIALAVIAVIRLLMRLSR